MKFVTNRIPFSTNRSFAEIVKEHLEKKAKKENRVIKTAAVAEEVKVAKEEKEAPSSGQPEAEAKLVNVPDKETPSKGCIVKKEEAPSSGQPEAEAKLTNDPKVEAKSEKGTKEAGLDMCKDCGKPFFACKCKKDEKKEDKENKEDKKAEVKAEIKEAVCEKCKKPGNLCICKKEEKKDDKKAKTVTKFVKIANLDPKTKTWLKEYWSKLYPVDFVDAMLADK